MLAFSPEIYDTLKLIHILAAVIWVGTGLYFQYAGTRLRRAGEPEALAWLRGAGRGGDAAADRVVDHGPARRARPGPVRARPWTSATRGSGSGCIGYAATFVTGNWFIRPRAERLAAADPVRGTDVADGAGGDRADLRDRPDRSGRARRRDRRDGVQARCLTGSRRIRRAGSRASIALLWASAFVVTAVTVVWTVGPDPPDAGSIPHVDKLYHAGAYAVTVFLLALAADWRPGRGSGRFPGSAVWIGVAAVAAGGALELVQHLTGRDTEFLDWVADAAGVAVALLVWASIRRRTDPARRPR